MFAKKKKRFYEFDEIIITYSILFVYKKRVWKIINAVSGCTTRSKGSKDIARIKRYVFDEIVPRFKAGFAVDQNARLN